MKAKTCKCSWLIKACCSCVFLPSAKMNQKHSILSPFDITSKLLGPYVYSATSRETLGDKMEYYFQDHSFVPLFIQVSAGLSASSSNSTVLVTRKTTSRHSLPGSEILKAQRKHWENSTLWTELLRLFRMGISLMRLFMGAPYDRYIGLSRNPDVINSIQTWATLGFDAAPCDLFNSYPHFASLWEWPPLWWSQFDDIPAVRPSITSVD